MYFFMIVLFHIIPDLTVWINFYKGFHFMLLSVILTFCMCVFVCVCTHIPQHTFRRQRVASRVSPCLLSFWGRTFLIYDAVLNISQISRQSFCLFTLRSAGITDVHHIWLFTWVLEINLRSSILWSDLLSLLNHLSDTVLLYSKIYKIYMFCYILKYKSRFKILLINQSIFQRKQLVSSVLTR